MGQISVSGLCLGNLERILTAKYRELYKDCRVAIAITNIRNMREIKILISGQVKKPGYVSVQAGSTVYEALLAAGGSTKMGSLRHVMLRQADNKTQQIDLYRLILSQDEVHLPQLREKNILSAPDIGPTVLIKGQVRRPGIYELMEGENLNDLVRYAGGAFPNTNLDQIKISRFDSAGSRQIMPVKGLNRKMAIQDGDVVSLTDLTQSKLEGKLKEKPEEKHNIRPVLLESFVEKKRFTGTCYKAAYWRLCGQTKGRGKLGPSGKISIPIKDVWLYPLNKKFRNILKN